ncbi:MAG: GNAT family N-acetyltransferase [Defluviitaleaceae bacterium]|nr:GNAT family N-acetyltransferase [Defluviitaleaceae bacterium]
MLTLKEAFSAEELAQCARIERAVFVDELGGDEAGVFANSKDAIHAIMYNGDKPIGTGRIDFDGTRWTISHLAVIPEERNDKLGDFLLRYLIRRVYDMGIEEVFIDPPDNVRGFFAKLGFEAAQGSLMRRSGDICGYC